MDFKQLYAVSEISTISEYNGTTGNYIKSFLINPQINYNGWQMPIQSIKSRLKEWIQKPIIQYITHKRTHPEYDDYNTAISDQEKYRVGTIIDVGYDSNTGNFWAVSEIHKKDIYQKIINHEIKYVSPSVFPVQFGGQAYPQLVTDGRPVHLALVDEPAYGGMAKIVGACSDDSKTKCKEELAPLVADINNTTHVREIPLILQKSSLILNHSKSKITMPDDTANKKIKELSAEIDELKKTVSAMNDDKETKSANDDTKEKEIKSANDDEKKKEIKSANDDEKKKDGMTADEKEEVKELKTQNASLMDNAKKPIITRILSASENNGATKEQIKNQTKFLNAATLSELQNFDANFITPLNLEFTNTATPIPDIAKVGELLSADVSADDTKLLQEAGIY